MSSEPYKPAPIPTESVDLPPYLTDLREKLAENAHENWALGRQKEGWTYGPKRDDELKQNPTMVPYDQLPDSEKDYDRNTAMETLKAISALGFRIVPPSSASYAERKPWPSEAPPEGSPLWEHLEGDHPKRILALDGGGLKGVLTLGFLERLEEQLGSRLSASGKIPNKDDFRLCQYFDLIGGTSTGAIIAGALANGMKASKLKEKYLSLGEDVFQARWHSLLTKNMRLFAESARFDKQALERHLKDLFGDIMLRSPELQTGLCVVAKRADSRSTWPLINHPRGKFYEFNGPLTLWRAIRASTAAPTFFKPQILPTGSRDEDGHLEQGAFVDGGVSMANNPSLQCFLAAVLDGFPFHWEMGPENLLIVSVGTGSAQYNLSMREVVNWKVWNLAQEIPGLLMDDAMWQNQLLMQALSRSPTNFFIDGEVGTAEQDFVTGPELFRYVRYDSLLQEKELNELVEFCQGTQWEKPLKKLPKLRRLRDMSDSRNLKVLAAIGEATAERDIPSDPEQLETHIPERFDTVIPVDQ